MSVNKIVQGLLSGNFKNIVVLTGAGISTGAGIPDFRSPGGMYDTLRPELITATRKQRKDMTNDPTEVVSFSLFKQNQFPYLEVRRPFILGVTAKKWKATLSHFFLAVLHEKGLLKRVYTQNIDGLDFQTGVPVEKMVNVHGSLGEVTCEFCSAPYPVAEFREAVRANIRNIFDPSDSEAPQESSNILCKECSRPGVKPNTVMYGRRLPESFYRSCEADFPHDEAADKADLLLVIGTSLTVAPANGIVEMVPQDCPRVVINAVPVGAELGLRYESESGSSRDHLLSGQCDEVLLDLCVQLGWEDDLFKHFDGMSDAGQGLIAAHCSRVNRPAPGTEDKA